MSDDRRWILHFMQEGAHVALVRVSLPWAWQMTWKNKDDDIQSELVRLWLDANTGDVVEMKAPPGHRMVPVAPDDDNYPRAVAALYSSDPALGSNQWAYVTPACIFITARQVGAAMGGLAVPATITRLAESDLHPVDGADDGARYTLRDLTRKRPEVAGHLLLRPQQVADYLGYSRTSVKPLLERLHEEHGLPMVYVSPQDPSSEVRIAWSALRSVRRVGLRRVLVVNGKEPADE
jgi:hypothetical protein